MQAISAALFPHLVFLWCTRLLWDSLKVNYISSFVLLHSLQETADQARTRKLMRSNNMRKIMKKKEMRKRKRKKMKMKMKTKKKNDQSYCDLVLLSFYCKLWSDTVWMAIFFTIQIFCNQYSFGANSVQGKLSILFSYTKYSCFFHFHRCSLFPVAD